MSSVSNVDRDIGLVFLGIGIPLLAIAVVLCLWYCPHLPTRRLFYLTIQQLRLDEVVMCPPASCTTRGGTLSPTDTPSATPAPSATPSPLPERRSTIAVAKPPRRDSLAEARKTAEDVLRMERELQTLELIERIPIKIDRKGSETVVSIAPSPNPSAPPSRSTSPTPSDSPQQGNSKTRVTISRSPSPQPPRKSRRETNEESSMQRKQRKSSKSSGTIKKYSKSSKKTSETSTPKQLSTKSLVVPQNTLKPPQSRFQEPPSESASDPSIPMSISAQTPQPSLPSHIEFSPIIVVTPDTPTSASSRKALPHTLPVIQELREIPSPIASDPRTSNRRAQLYDHWTPEYETMPYSDDNREDRRGATPRDSYEASAFTGYHNNYQDTSQPSMVYDRTARLQVVNEQCGTPSMIYPRASKTIPLPIAEEVLSSPKQQRRRFHHPKVEIQIPLTLTDIVEPTGSTPEQSPQMARRKLEQVNHLDDLPPMMDYLLPPRSSGTKSGAATPRMTPSSRASRHHAHSSKSPSSPHQGCRSYQREELLSPRGKVVVTGTQTEEDPMNRLPAGQSQSYTEAMSESVNSFDMMFFCNNGSQETVYASEYHDAPSSPPQCPRGSNSNKGATKGDKETRF